MASALQAIAAFRMASDGSLPRGRFIWPCVAALAPLAAIAVYAKWAGGGVVSMLTRDVTATADVHPLTGALSSMGAFLWFASAIVCLQAASVCRSSSDKNLRRLLQWAAALSFFLWFDDFFLFHERLAPMMGIGQLVANGVLALWVLAYCALVFATLPFGSFVPLAFAVALLGGSMVLDNGLEALNIGSTPMLTFAEDGLKWLGICAWLRFHWMLSRSVLTPERPRSVTAL